ncbi:mannosylfructose-phosphate synthase [Variibacter gotjawalensis]|uniref:Mannosylfructose-phosphate synthase n=1 Tax=Variibacter gotjawalensis TaxID=1333996 RepID=A0A0S3PUH1_9BRAD|nr:MSMEG_0565 family glycosyltransferase [Variibacter gotjawalensis]NIK49891.1 glycosyltransferase-like protein [Variibacter gotjawalensis]RZS45890.1 glycosyltransferase-like protein [Variibacter gotjawalensis]BAT59565.1 mannosylfructose-phosphate synthase [Variibacter gotjawalensis]
MSRPLRIAMLTHSTNPRGGVVHALQLADALCGLGHEVAVHAPDPAQRGFFRQGRAKNISVEAAPAPHNVGDMVEQRIAEYVEHFSRTAHAFDVFHAHDGIGANALATLKERGMIRSFLRTVHHLDVFRDPRVQKRQEHSITAADALFVVSPTWADALQRDYGRAATVVGNGVDLGRFSPNPSVTDAALRARLRLGRGPILLCVGGVEERKNSIRILRAFVGLRATHPDAQLVIAGGASVLDHSAYNRAFQSALDEAALPAGSLILPGVMSDAEMAALYRLADVLVFASVKEGFGLVVLEALASGTPVVVPRIAPFTGYLGENDAAWCDPYDVSSITNAIQHALTPARDGLIANGYAVAQRHGWAVTARAHLPVYAAIAEPAYA